jgi:hypothetical protein
MHLVIKLEHLEIENILGLLMSSLTKLPFLNLSNLVQIIEKIVREINELGTFLLGMEVY